MLRCIKGKETTTTISTNACSSKLRCNNGKCYSEYQKCNFIDDCGDSTDEYECPAICNFESGWCGWYSPDGFVGKLIITQGQSPSLKNKGTGPKFDHTFGNSSGHYVVSTNLKKVSDLVQFHSPYYSVSGATCRFNFSYFMSGKQIGEMDLYLVLNTELESTKKVSLISLKSFKLLFQ